MHYLGENVKHLCTSLKLEKIQSKVLEWFNKPQKKNQNDLEKLC